MNKITKELKFFLKPLGVLIVLIVLIIITLNFGLGQINSVKAKIKKSNKDEKILITKVNTLKNVAEVLPSDISFIDIVLPSKGTSLYSMSQIKNQAYPLGLLVTNLKTGSAIQTQEGVSKTSLSFDVQGNEQVIYSYLGLFPKLLPLMKVDKVDISKAEGIANATVTLSTFSGDLPKEIPSITTPITDLSNDEIKTLKDISGFLLPQFIIPSVSIEASREDPFTL